MNTIIALRGDPDTGKSTTIGYLYEELIKKDFYILKARRNYGNKPSHDFLAILEFNKIKIGITSYGDVPKLIIEKIKILIEANCAIIICACHKSERGHSGPNFSITQFKNYRHMFFEKSINVEASTQRLTNQYDANKIIEIVEALVK